MKSKNYTVNDLLNLTKEATLWGRPLYCIWQRLLSYDHNFMLDDRAIRFLDVNGIDP
jgi:hypothetical protein